MGFSTRKTWKIDVKISSCGKLSSAVEVSGAKRVKEHVEVSCVDFRTRVLLFSGQWRILLQMAAMSVYSW